MISSNGKEARHPYLDEDFVDCIKSIPLEHMCNFSLPNGEGDKRLLRLAALHVGLENTSVLAKRVKTSSVSQMKTYHFALRQCNLGHE